MLNLCRAIIVRRMTPTDIAKLLLAKINAPIGAVSIFAEPEPKTGFVLRVWVNSNARVPDDMPREFHGHPVIVQKTPHFSPSP